MDGTIKSHPHHLRYAARIVAVVHAHTPIVQAMFRAYPGSHDAYVYGPICVAESERGHGLATALFAKLRERLPGRECVAFVRCDNAASLQAHLKMGMNDVA